MTDKSLNGERLTVTGDGRGPVYRLPFTVWALLLICPHPVTAQIQDNSFLLEEAYNQETGVVQHISAFERASGGDWAYAFTQEWPLGGIRHQLSYTIPIESIEGFGTGLGDVALNYRHQLAGNPDARTVVASRLSILLPTGDEEEGRGAGAIGFQLNLPLTLVLSNEIVTHWNVGATVTPSARSPLGEKATTTAFNLGASVVWLFRPSFNFLVEAVWDGARTVVGNGRTVPDESLVLNPGVRFAFDLPGDLQIVPGLAYIIDSGAAENGLFFYLSFEHPFKR
jgi:hypothetical protein